MSKPFRFHESGFGEQSVRVVFGDTTYLVRVKGDGSASAPWAATAGGALGGAARRASRGSGWMVETVELEPASLHMQLGGKPIAQEPFRTKEEAVARANELLDEWGAGAPA